MDTDSIKYEYDPRKYNIKRGWFLGEWTDELDDGKIVSEVAIGPKACTHRLSGEKKACCIKVKGIRLHHANL